MLIKKGPLKRTRTDDNVDKFQDKFKKTCIVEVLPMCNDCEFGDPSDIFENQPPDIIMPINLDNQTEPVTIRVLGWHTETIGGKKVLMVDKCEVEKL